MGPLHRCEPSDTEPQRALSEQHVRNWLRRIYKNCLQVLPCGEQLVWYILSKRYAVDLAAHMITGTVLVQQGDDLDQVWREGLADVAATSTLRLKPGLSSGGYGHKVVTTQGQFKAFCASTFRRVPSGVVICQPELEHFSELRFLVTGTKLFRSVHLDRQYVACLALVKPAKRKRPQSILEQLYLNAEQMLQEVLVLFGRLGFSPPEVWRIDLVSLDELWYLNEIEVIGGTFDFDMYEFHQAAADAIRASILRCTQA
jgi:hypothetical protein